MVQDGGRGAAAAGRLVRLGAGPRAPIAITIDGVPAEAREGDSVLVAVLTSRGDLRAHEFDGGRRAGFCLMGACQDCWVWLAGARRVRACTTPVAAGMAVLTAPPRDFPFHV